MAADRADREEVPTSASSWMSAAHGPRALLFGFRVALLLLVSGQALASECNWLQMGIAGFGARMDESSCTRLLEWDAYVQENEQAALKQTPFYSDPRYELLLSGIVGRMQEAIETTYGPQPHYSIHLVADNSINAAATGGQIFVNRGTLLFFMEPRGFWRAQGFNAQATENAMRQVTPWDNDIEALVFILAHEVGHNVLGHPTSAVGFICGQHLDAVHESQVRAQKRAAKDEELQAQGKKVGLWRKFGRALATGAAGGMGSLLGSVEFKQYQQGYEDQADQFGVLTLKQVGLDPQAGARSLGYLATVYGYAQENSAIMNTILCSDHPDSLARVERAANLGHQVARRVEPSQWPAQVDLSTIRVRYAQSKFAEAYGQRNYSDALGWLERGLQYAPDEPVLLYDKACVFISLDQLDGAISLLRTAIELQPDLRDFAKTDRDLNPLASMPEFQALVGTAMAP